MTIIHEEDLEDSALISNFNSRFATTFQMKNLSATHASLMTGSNPKLAGKNNNSDLSAVIEEYPKLS